MDANPRRSKRYSTVLAAWACLALLGLCDALVGAQEQFLAPQSSPAVPVQPGVCPPTVVVEEPGTFGSFAPQIASQTSPGAWDGDVWTWQVLPDGLMYSPYLAATKEPRIGVAFNNDKNLGWIADCTVGGRVGLIRYGTESGKQRGPRPQGWELDLEAAAFVRLDYENDREVSSADYRLGIPLTYAIDRFQFRFGLIHTCSHLGDNYMIRFPDYQRIDYSRHALELGAAYFLTDDLKIYGQASWGFYTWGASKPWEFMTGIDYSPLWAMGSFWGSPYAAINGDFREETDYQGELNVQVGWQWRGKTGHLFRVGAQYFNGPSEQYQFARRHENKVGVGVWYDF